MDNLDYGAIGNGRSAALVSKNGSIDWCCLPEFDSASVFANILDENIGGRFAIQVSDDYTISQKYIHKTNLLKTTYSNGNDQFQVIDFMPRYINGDNRHHLPPEIIRYVKLLSGKPRFKPLYNPRLDYARNKTDYTIEGNYLKSFTTKGRYDSLYLYTNFSKNDVLNSAEIELEDDGFFLVSYNQKILKQTVEMAKLKMERTKVYWLNWTEKLVKFSKYNDEIVRSSLVLKLMSYDKSGAILAALTTSLPETIGEVRNWDYRFCWIRDSSMVIKVLTNLGQRDVAFRYMKFIMNIIPMKHEKIQIMYGLRGEKKLTEQILDHLDGYKGSKPVRIGNAAYKQKQNDIYGILVDVIYQQLQILGATLEESEALWTITRSISTVVESNWNKPDRGIWELRTEAQHFTFSKVLCWVSFDRAVKIADMFRRKDYVRKWTKVRDKIADDIMKNAWNERVGAFTQYYGSEDLDASVLLMEPYGFIEATDERYIKTVKAIEEELSHNGLMFRYKNSDDFGTPKSSFTICTFWLVNALHRIGEKEKAESMFEKVLSYSNHVGLFSEDIDFESKRLLGNFPQAYSHLAIIETAINISGGGLSHEEQIIECIH
ncbi:MAG: glycoside hydrolase family 15 protein [Salinivirgaceae bacterium]|jgi:GH15 family glucan-1,4-alpha-glucosidase|nr:glycoside hydrolase family 15 protein [Salinivirgaceae bacterium]